MDRVEVVQAMQDYIRIHVDEVDFTLEKMYQYVGYSKRHADRMFKELIRQTPQEYVKAICLSEGAKRLLKTDKNVLEIALDSHFGSQEGFSRAFESRFQIFPAKYRKSPLPIPLFTQYPIKQYYVFKQKEEKEMAKETTICMVTEKERKRRKLIFQPSKTAEDYFSYCEEMGCDWEGMLNSIPEKLDTAALIFLPEYLIQDGWSKTAAGVEVPLDYNKKIPEGYETAELDTCFLLYFETEPYEKEEDFCIAIESAYQAVEKYNPERYGYQYAYDKCPSFNFGATASMGAKLAIPVVKL